MRRSGRPAQLSKANASTLTRCASFLGGVVIYFLLVTLYQVQFESTKLCSANRKETRTTTLNGLTDESDSGKFEKSYRKDRGRMLLVGVMTADQYLDSRAVAIHHTWAKTIPGKLLYFVGSSWPASRRSVPIHVLPQVNDKLYPPQRKFWRMLRYMYDCCRNDYDWFMRADDDLSVRTDRLESLLHRLNSSQPIYLGQGGQGGSAEAQIWDHQHFYCMTGTGLILSRALLLRVVPLLKHCASKLIHSDWDDLEFGRCVVSTLNIDCTRNFEMERRFLNNRGRLNTSFSHSLVGFDTSSADRRIDPFDSFLLNAVTLHPVKNATFQFRLDHFHKFQTLRALEQSREQLEVSLRKETYERTLEVSNVWSATTHHTQHAIGAQNPAVGCKSDFPNVLPRRIFQEIAAKEPGEWKRTLKHSTASYLLHDTMDPLEQVLLTPAVGSSQRLTYMQAMPRARISRVRDLLVSPCYSASTCAPNDAVGVHLVLPICGNQRSSVFGKFLATFDALLLGDKHLRGSTFLLLVFCDDDSRSKHSIESSNANVHVLVLHKPSFSRAEAMNAGAAHVYGNLKTSGLPEEAIVFFIDVDMQITGATLNRVRYNTRKGEVYYPIVLVGYDHLDADGNHVHDAASTYEESEFASKWFPEGNARGSWSFHGFGMVAMFVTDWFSHARWNEAILSWGMEDVELHDRILQQRQLAILRAPDPGMAHSYHPANCTARLAQLSNRPVGTEQTTTDALNDERDRYRMCLGSMYSHVSLSADFVLKLNQVV